MKHVFGSSAVTLPTAADKDNDESCKDGKDEYAAEDEDNYPKSQGRASRWPE